MKERSHEPELNLLPDTRDLIDEIQRATGLPVEIRADSTIRGHGRAVYAASDPDTSRHLILYDPQFDGFIDHLVAHECGHLVRYACASPAERVVPVLTRDQRRTLTQQILPDIEDLIDRGLPERAVAEVLPIWLGGTIAQLQNTPADIHIERWLHREFPGLRRTQTRSVESMAREYHLVLRPEVRSCTPRALWEASNAMNYAYLKALGVVMGREDLVQPYRGSRAESAGAALLRMLDAVPDTGFQGDRSLSDRWAQQLALEGLLNWTRVDRLPEAARHLWEASRDS
jgi:hypothetical protein